MLYKTGKGGKKLRKWSYPAYWAHGLQPELLEPFPSVCFDQSKTPNSKIWFFFFENFRIK